MVLEYDFNQDPNSPPVRNEEDLQSDYESVNEGYVAESNSTHQNSEDSESNCSSDNYSTQKKYSGNESMHDNNGESSLPQQDPYKNYWYDELLVDEYDYRENLCIQHVREDNESLSDESSDGCDDGLIQLEDVGQYSVAHCSKEPTQQYSGFDEIYNSTSSEDTDESESDIPNEEVERMLEDALIVSETIDGVSKKRTSTQAGFEKKKPFEEKAKTVLIEKGFNHFDVLPEGWIQVTHNSGLHVYLHKAGRVCTLARPYFLGPGSATKHDIPLSGIPCLSYKKAMEDEVAATKAAEAEKENAHKQEELPYARIETIRENIEQNNLSPQRVNQYARRRFRFKKVNVMLLNSWSEKRKKQHHDRQLQRPTLPEGTKLISFPVLGNDTDDNKNPKREWIMNPNGKSYVCILHEYVQHALKKQPSYKFAELDNVTTPYSATVTINDMQYGIGLGTSKKQAKSAAAKATLEILIPEMRTKIATDSRMGGAAASKARDQDLSLFDEIKVVDPRVAEFCAKTTEPSPHDVLLTCLQRNFGLGDLHISYQGNTLKHQRNEFTMRVGKHSATVVCKNKRDGKQRASQAILQALHPHITSWGALLRLYGTRSVKSFKEKKMEEQEITLLQSKAAVNSPNFAILDKLRLELTKIKEKRDREITNPQVPMSSGFPSGSACTLNSVDL